MENATPIYIDLWRVIGVFLVVAVVMGALFLFERDEDENEDEFNG